MAIDPSIALNVKPVQIDSPLDAYAKVAQVQSMRDQNRIAQLMFGEKQREVEESSALNRLYKDAVGADGQIDRSKLYTGLAQGGLGARLPAIQKTFAEQDKSLLESQKAKLETGLKQFETVAQIMSGVKDQASYDVARQEIASIVGPEAAAKIQPVYDPAVIEQNKIKALSVKDQMEQRWKYLEYKLNTEKFTYQQKNDAENRNVTIRGQDKVDARGRDANRLKEAEIAMGGKPPPGYRWAPDGQSLVAIPGGPGDKLPEAQQKQVIGTQNLSNAIAEYRKELAGFGGWSKLSPDQRAKMGTKYNNMMLQAKEAYNLGVLNGPDLEIMTNVITDPRSPKALFISKEALDTQASELDRMMGGVAQVSGQARPKPQQPKSPANTSAPKAGTVEGGYRFKGGNPADPKSWEKM